MVRERYRRVHYRRIRLLLMFTGTDEKQCVALRIGIYLENQRFTTHRRTFRRTNVPRALNNGHDYFTCRSFEPNLKLPVDLGIAVPHGCALYLNNRTVVVPLPGQAGIISAVQLSYCGLNCDIERLPKRFCITEKLISCNLLVKFAWFVHPVLYPTPFRHQAG